MTILAVERLGKSYRGFEAVKDVSFAMEAGEMLALIGPNGAGKSTCFNMINGQIAPTRGAHPYFRPQHRGHDAARNRAARRRADVSDRRDFRVDDGRRERPDGAARASRRLWTTLRWAARAHAGEARRLLALVGMADQAERSCGELAYGDLKRLELAIALANDPKLLLMDEPAAGMAPKERHALMNLTARIARERGIGVLFTEHDMDVVFGHADRVLVLNRGLLIAEGSPAAVRANPQVRAVYLGAGVLQDAPP